jgi:plasmid stabilization system protein ParE
VKKRKVLYTRAAQADLDEAYGWYHSIDPILAERLIGDLRNAEARVAAHPLSCQVFVGTTRRAQLRIFPYCVYYRLERGSIVVHAILHTRRSPALHRGRAE